MTAIEVPALCPGCGEAAIASVPNEPPWCTACEWNLAHWPAPRDRSGRRAVRDRRAAFELNRRLLGEFDGVLPDRPRVTKADDILSAAAGALSALDLLLVAGGGYLLVTGNWLLKFVGVVLILFGVECRPRFGRIDDGAGLSRAAYPNLWAVVDAAQRAVGAPPVDVLTVSNDFNASCSRSGLRQRVTLDIGLPLWAALGPAGRIALLGHELGHLVNGDPTRTLWRQSALTTFGRLAHIFDPRSLDDSRASGYYAITDPRNAVSLTLAALVTYVLFSPVHLLFSVTQRALLRVAAEEHQRAEVYADGIGARLGGAAGALELALAQLSPDLVNSGLVRAAEASEDPAIWHGEVLGAVGMDETHLRFAEQRSLRTQASRFASHPPDGLRSRLALSWLRATPSHPVPELPVDELAAADRELARAYKSARRAILNRSVF